MPVDKCRVCGGSFFPGPLLRYDNMPGGAQNMPDAEKLRGPDDSACVLEVCQCSGCGLVQLNNDPVPYYKDVIRASAFSPEMKNARIRQFSEFTEQFDLKNKKIIEIGCGCGEYLEIMKNFIGNACGLEHSEEAVRSCLEKGLTVSQGFIDDERTEIHGAPFDAFLILNFLEHVPDPGALLRGIYNNLTEDGTGIVEVPNFNMIIEKNLFSEFVRDHLFYFTTETLSTLLELNGFELIDCSLTWYDYIISAVVKKRKKLDVSDFNSHQESLKKEISGYADRFEKLAIWGAGHQALAVMAILKEELSSRVKYVIDSAVFKQGKFTPVTHFPIVAPEMIEKDTVDAVIIMAAGYSDEVAGILTEKYGSAVKNIAILRESGLEVLR